MCTNQYKNPIPTVDVIIQTDFQILFVKRKNNPFKQYLALSGGFVDEGTPIQRMSALASRGWSYTR
jgi:8-oxo-dGTP diphosphatase